MYIKVKINTDTRSVSMVKPSFSVSGTKGVNFKTMVKAVVHVPLAQLDVPPGQLL